MLRLGSPIICPSTSLVKNHRTLKALKPSCIGSWISHSLPTDGQRHLKMLKMIAKQRPPIPLLLQTSLPDQNRYSQIETWASRPWQDDDQMMTRFRWSHDDTMMTRTPTNRTTPFKGDGILLSIPSSKKDVAQQETGFIHFPHSRWSYNNILECVAGGFQSRNYLLVGDSSSMFIIFNSWWKRESPILDKRVDTFRLAGWVWSPWNIKHSGKAPKLMASGFGT